MGLVFNIGSRYLMTPPRTPGTAPAPTLKKRLAKCLRTMYLGVERYPAGDLGKPLVAGWLWSATYEGISVWPLRWNLSWRHLFNAVRRRHGGTASFMNCTVQGSWLLTLQRPGGAKDVLRHHVEQSRWASH